MITIMGDGNNGHYLEDADSRRIAHIRQRTVRLGGLESKTQAIAATAEVRRVLDAELTRHLPGWPSTVSVAEQLHLVHDGAYEWISDGQKPLARLVTAAFDGATYKPWSIEFVFPSYVNDGVLISSAHVMVGALQAFLQREAGAPQNETSLLADVEATSRTASHGRRDARTPAIQPRRSQSGDATVTNPIGAA